MKTKVFKTIAILLIFSAVAVQTKASSSSEIKKETRNVGEFSGISMAIPANLYLTQGNKCELIIEADEDILEKIETKVSGETLDIEFEKWYNYRGTSKINLYITVKDLNKLVLAGSGDIIAKTTINAENLKLIITGSGSILIDELNVGNVYSMISGSGDIRIAGTKKAKELEATITGSGDFESVNLEFSKADLTITGSGSIRAFVSDDLEATITGSGRIYYKGQPLVDANITGSGKIKKED